jgi:L-ascorbate 6-phosphate lactonase
MGGGVRGGARAAGADLTEHRTGEAAPVGNGADGPVGRARAASGAGAVGTLVAVEAVPFGHLSAALATPPPGGLAALYWLGGAGIALQAPDGRSIFVDPYLSDLCERRHGFRRLTPPPLLATDAAPATWIATHHHADHLDVDAIAVSPARERAAFAAPPSCVEGLTAAGVAVSRVTALRPGMAVRAGPARIRAVPADHGPLAPDAVGVVVDFGGLRLYHAGDTAYRDDIVAAVGALAPQVAVLPINGRYGNLTPDEAARAAARLGVRVAAPCHYWLLAEHGGVPGAFVTACAAPRPAVTPVLIPLGGRCLLRPAPLAPPGTATPGEH